MLTIISDVHIKTPLDGPSKLFCKFLSHEKVLNSDSVILLGDIFDFLVGGDDSFVQIHKEVFDRIHFLLNKGVKVYYLEGNHDFHLNKFFKKHFRSDNFVFSKKNMIIEDAGKKILLCHGDDIEIENLNYKLYTCLIKSLPMKILVESIMPFGLAKTIGDWVSARSRKKNVKVYESAKEQIKDKFRRSSESAAKKINIDFIISGHSHIKDEYKSENGFIYLNNGYAPKEKTFLLVEGASYRFVELSD